MNVDETQKGGRGRRPKGARQEVALFLEAFPQTVKMHARCIRKRKCRREGVKSGRRKGKRDVPM